MPVLVVSKKSKTYQPRYTDYIINWGCSTAWDFITANKFKGNEIAVNKLTTFDQLTWWNEQFPTEAVNIPEWTTDKTVVQDWLSNSYVVVARTILNGHSGKGICLLDNEQDDIPSAPLYVKYKKKKHEYRVHVYKNEVIDITQKKKRKDATFVDTKIRNHANGWVYAREGISVTDELLRTAKCAVSALGLQHGAVDIIWNEKENKYYVLEINSAPGLVGQTTEAYVNKIIEDINNGQVK